MNKFYKICLVYVLIVVSFLGFLFASNGRYKMSMADGKIPIFLDSWKGKVYIQYEGGKVFDLKNFKPSP